MYLAGVSMADWQEDSNAHCRENDANALCATCGKVWGSHIGRCCDGDESSPRRFKLAAPPENVRDLIEQLCSAAVAYGERDTKDAENAYYAAKAHLIGAACGAKAPSHHGLCSSLDDTMPNYPNCDCGEAPSNDGVSVRSEQSLGAHPPMDPTP